jgi:hypothetical protein
VALIWVREVSREDVSSGCHVGLASGGWEYEWPYKGPV